MPFRLDKWQNAEFTNERVRAVGKTESGGRKKSRGERSAKWGTGVDGFLLPAVSATPVPGM